MSIDTKQAMTTQVKYVKPDDNLSVAYAQMKKENIRHLPVVDEEGVLIGIISNRDIQRAMWPLNTVDAHGFPDGPTFEQGDIVADYMSWPVKTLSEDCDLITVIRAMRDEKISAVVLTRKDQVTGIVTHEDLLRVLEALLQKPETIKDKVFALTQNSPLSQVTDFLAGIGI